MSALFVVRHLLETMHSSTMYTAEDFPPFLSNLGLLDDEDDDILPDNGVWSSLIGIDGEQDGAQFTTNWAAIPQVPKTKPPLALLNLGQEPNTQRQALSAQNNYTDHLFPATHLIPWITGVLQRKSVGVAFLCGAPSSGKTTIAQEVAKHFNAQACVVSSDLPSGMPGVSARDHQSAMWSQYISQLERAKKHSFAILYDGMHLDENGTKEKLQLAVLSGISLENVAWFVCDQQQEEEQEVALLMRRQKARFARFWNTDQQAPHQSDARIAPVDTVRMNVQKLRATYMDRDLRLLKWDDAKLLEMIADEDPDGFVARHFASKEPQPEQNEPWNRSAPAPGTKRFGWPGEDLRIEVPQWPHQQQPSPRRGSDPRASPPLASGPSADSVCHSWTPGPSPGPSLGPSPVPSPYPSRIVSPVLSPRISPTLAAGPRRPSFGVQVPGVMPLVFTDPGAPSLSGILKANYIRTSRPLSPQRCAASWQGPAKQTAGPSQATLNAVADIVMTLKRKTPHLHTKTNSESPTANQASQLLLLYPTTKTAPAARPAAPATAPAATNGAASPTAGALLSTRLAPDYQVPRQIQGLLPTPPQVVMRPPVFRPPGQAAEDPRPQSYPYPAGACGTGPSPCPFP